MLGSKRLRVASRHIARRSTIAFSRLAQILSFNGGGRGDMIRFTSAAIALAWASLSASHGYAAPVNDARQPPGASAALITNCYRKAEWIVPRGRGRSAWVVRHADHCVRSGGAL